MPTKEELAEYAKKQEQKIQTNTEKKIEELKKRDPFIYKNF